MLKVTDMNPLKGLVFYPNLDTEGEFVGDPYLDSNRCVSLFLRRMALRGVPYNPNIEEYSDSGSSTRYVAVTIQQEPLKVVLACKLNNRLYHVYLSKNTTNNQFESLGTTRITLVNDDRLKVGNIRLEDDKIYVSMTIQECSICCFD